MRSTRPVTALLTILALASCSDAVQAPTEITLPPAFARGGATATNQVIVVPVDNTVFIECAGEDVRFTGETTFRLHETVTPAGVSILHVTIPASESSVTATGQTSGTVWTLSRGASTQTIVRKEGETNVVNVTQNETYVAGDGSTLRLHRNLHISTSNGGSAEVDTEEWTCGA